MPDPRLIELVDQLPRTSFSGDAFRHQGPGYPPLNVEGSRIHGGRWNPRESFPVLYLALSVATAAAEFYRLADRQGIEAARLLPRRLYRYEVQLSAVSDLTQIEMFVRTIAASHRDGTGIIGAGPRAVNHSSQKTRSGGHGSMLVERR